MSLPVQTAPALRLLVISDNETNVHKCSAICLEKPHPTSNSSWRKPPIRSRRVSLPMAGLTDCILLDYSCRSTRDGHPARVDRPATPAPRWRSGQDRDDRSRTDEGPASGLSAKGAARRRPTLDRGEVRGGTAKVRRDTAHFENPRAPGIAPSERWSRPRPPFRACSRWKSWRVWLLTERAKCSASRTAS